MCRDCADHDTELMAWTRSLNMKALAGADATESTIKKWRRSALLQVHPDRVTGVASNLTNDAKVAMLSVDYINNILK